MTVNNIGAVTDLGNTAKRDDLPDFRAGDTVKVHVKVTEGTRSRVQIFQGVVIRIQGSGIGRTFTVRADRGRDPRRRPPGEAVLPAQPAREGRQDQGASRDLRSVLQATRNHPPLRLAT